MREHVSFTLHILYCNQFCDACAPMFNIRVLPLPFCSFFDSARQVPLADDIDYVAVYDWLDVELARHMLDGCGLLLWRNYCFWYLIYWVIVEICLSYWIHVEGTLSAAACATVAASYTWMYRTCCHSLITLYLSVYSNLRHMVFSERPDHRTFFKTQVLILHQNQSPKAPNKTFSTVDLIFLK